MGIQEDTGSDLPAHVLVNLTIFSDEDLAANADHGSGTEADPYVIENRVFSGPVYGIAYIDITNTRSHLVLRNLDINGTEDTTGIYLINVTNVVVEDCTLRNVSLEAFWFNGVSLVNNRIYGAEIDIGSGWVVGSDLTGNSNMVVAGNQVLDSEYVGTRVHDCKNLTISNNTVLGCHSMGLSVSSSENVLVTDNNLTGNWKGLGVWDSNAVTVVANDIAESTWTGVVLDSSSDVLVHHNNIMNNSMEVDIWGEVIRTELSLGYPHGGNYWSNNTSPDLLTGPGQNVTGPDGISDLPVNISYGIRDQYPLSAPFRRTSDSESPVPRIFALPHFGRPNCTFVLDAAPTWDSEDSALDLQFRWDWTNDGSWDTQWSSQAVVTYTHAGELNGTARMVAKDRDGLTGETTCQLIVDRLAPVLTTDFGPGRVKFTTHDSIWINWSCEEGLSGLAEMDPDSITSAGHYRIMINGIDLMDSGSPVTGYMMMSGGNGYSETVNLSVGGLPDGDYTVIVQACDVAGNPAEIRIDFEIRTNPLNPEGPNGVWPFVVLVAGICAAVIVVIYLAIRPKKGSPEASSVPKLAEIS